MATEAQINANRQNAQHSTGPRTDAGKAASARNHITLGLYTRQDYVKPDERDLYKEFCQTMYSDLTPASLLEEAFVSEIAGATWRLRRCSSAEGELADYATRDPLLDDATEKTRRSIERARASAHSILHRSINQLRKLQTERITRTQLRLEDTADAPLAESRKICQTLNLHLRNGKLLPAQKPQPAQQLHADRIESIMNSPAPDWSAIDLDIAKEKAALASNCQRSGLGSGSLVATTAESQPNVLVGAPAAPQMPRSAPCPCHSGEKFKRCCGKNSPPMLGRAA